MTVTTLVEVLERAVDGDLADSLGILEVMTMCVHCGFSEPVCAAGRRRGSRGCCPDCDHPHPWEAEEAGGGSPDVPGLNHTYGNRGGGWVHPGLEEAKRRADEAMAERRAAEEAARAAAEQLEGQGSLFDVEP